MTLDPGRIQAIFLAILAMDTPLHRATVLDRECSADDELRRRVEALLIAHDRPDGPLDRPFGYEKRQAKLPPTGWPEGGP